MCRQMISLFFLAFFCLDYGAATKLKDENYNKPGEYNCINGGKYLEMSLSVLFLSTACDHTKQAMSLLKQDVKRRWKTQELLEKISGNQQQARYFSHMGKHPLSITKYKHFCVMKRQQNSFRQD